MPFSVGSREKQKIIPETTVSGVLQLKKKTGFFVVVVIQSDLIVLYVLPERGLGSCYCTGNSVVAVKKPKHSFFFRKTLIIMYVRFL